MIVSVTRNSLNQDTTSGRAGVVLLSGHGDLEFNMLARRWQARAFCHLVVKLTLKGFYEHGNTNFFTP
jgi:hypothetical protein